MVKSVAQRVRKSTAGRWRSFRLAGQRESQRDANSQLSGYGLRPEFPASKAALAVGRVGFDGSFDPAKSGAPQSARPSAARERGGWRRSTGRVFRREFGWKALAHVKVRLQRSQPPQSAPLLHAAVRGKSRSASSPTAATPPARRVSGSRGIEPIAPDRENDKLRLYEDGREHPLSSYYAFFRLACLCIALRRQMRRQQSGGIASPEHSAIRVRGKRTHNLLLR